MSIFKKIIGLFSGTRKQDEQKKQRNDLDISQLRKLTQKEKLRESLSANLSLIREYHGNSFGLQVREFKINPTNINAAIVFIEGMVDTATLDEVMRTLLIDTLKIDNFKRVPLPQGGMPLLKFIRDKVITAAEITEITELDTLFDHVLLGDTAFILDGVETALAIDTKGWKSRNIQETDTEISIRGPRESFIEPLQDNLALIRRRIRIPQLWIEGFRVGSLTRTQVALVYIKGLAGEEIVEEARSRLQKIDTDSIFESGGIEDFVEDNPFTLFPLLLRTERPDRVASSLVEGQIAIFTDGTPFVLLAPATFFSMLQAPDDAFEKFPMGTFVRFLRYVAITASTFLPGIYISVINFHPELLPTTLLLRIASTREGIPFPVVLEMIIMESVFELLREAGVRLPAPIGTAISIVGALVLGDAAISAGIVSPPVVIIVALTAIASFTVPNFALGIAGRLLRFIFIAFGAVFGLFGIQFGIFLLVVHLCALRSFGIPYLVPTAPLVWRDMKDHILHLWKWGLFYRPRLIGFREPVRQNPQQTKRFFKLNRDQEGGEDHED
ncbi:MAG: spore germination protein [Dethiobacteria bacterium]|jgi:spore germination protein KA